MKHLIILSILSACLSSCSTYYYSILSNDLSHNNYQIHSGEFISENDSIIVTYSFNGEKGPIRITVYNKLDKPLYVNWLESSLIVDGEAISYFDGNTTFSGTSYGSSVIIKDHPRSPVSYGGSINQFEGSINAPKNITYIPPQTKINYNSLSLNAENLTKIDKKYYSKRNLANKNNKPFTVEAIDFDKESSPLQFRSFLSLYYKQNEPFYVNDSFFLSQLIKTNKSPNKLPERFINRGNIFYLQTIDYTGAYIGLGVASAAAIIAIISYDGPSLDTSPPDWW